MPAKRGSRSKQESDRQTSENDKDENQTGEEEGHTDGEGENHNRRRRGSKKGLQSKNEDDTHGRGTAWRPPGVEGVRARLRGLGTWVRDAGWNLV